MQVTKSKIGGHDSGGVAAAVVAIVILFLLAAVAICCFLRRRRVKRDAQAAGIVSATAGRSGGARGGPSRPMSLYFRNPNFGRARLSTTSGEELKDVCVADFGVAIAADASSAGGSSSKKGDPSLAELHNPDFTSALLHASASNQDLRPRSPRYVGMQDDEDGSGIRRCRTNPNLGYDVDAEAGSASAFAPRATFTIDSRRSGDSSTSSDALAPSTSAQSTPAQSSLGEENDLEGVLGGGDGDDDDKTRLL